MSTMDKLTDTLARLDGKSYKAYKDIAGSYTGQWFTLHIDHVQGDPFGSPSRLRITIPWGQSGFSEELVANERRRIAFRDYLARAFSDTARTRSRSRGSGSSGRIDMDRPGAEILERSSVALTETGIEARFTVGLPARGRRILGAQATEVLRDDIPSIAETALTTAGIDEKRCRTHIEVSEDAHAIRDQLAEHGLVAFIGNGSVLPRESGVSERPLRGTDVRAFESPQRLAITLERPHHGPITGMAIPRGITLIVGGGFHGKSTLLNAVQRGVYNHIPEDGREWVISEPDLVKVRAEDGRSITDVNISPFISDLPTGTPTDHFTSENASGSTSQAATIMEALELGAGTLCMDEDTSATNFMIRDQRMQELVISDKEPITPYIDKVRQLYDEYGVSTLLVLGGSGDYLDRANTVIAMDTFEPHDVTERARTIANQYTQTRAHEGGSSFGAITDRRISASFETHAPRGKRIKTKVPHRHMIQLGNTAIDLAAAEQLVHAAQTRAIATALLSLLHNTDQTAPLRERIMDTVAALEHDGIDALSRTPTDGFASFRRFELAAALNRLRILQTR